MKRRRSGFYLALALSLLATFLVLDLVEIVYHMSHGGWKSGITQIAMALLLLMLAFLVAWSYSKREESAAWKNYLLAVAIIVLIAAASVLYLSIYHFTHEGTRSGIIELCMTLLLLALGYCVLRLWGE